MSHHASPDQDPRSNDLAAAFGKSLKEKVGPALDKLLEAEAKAEGFGSTGEFPRGKISTRDEGELKMGVTSDRKTGTIILNFGKPVEWVGFCPAEARMMSRLLLKHANTLEGK